MSIVTYLIVAVVFACFIFVLRAGGSLGLPYGALSVTLGFAALGLPAFAVATPTTATLTLKSVPIPVNLSVAKSPRFIQTPATS